MNILLFLPGLLVLLFQYTGFFETFKAVVIIIFVQLGLPSMHFLDDVPNIIAYFTSAFDFSRQFLYKWTVNWHMLGEERFLSQKFAKGLLIAHVITLIAFGWCRWNPVPGGTAAVLKRGLFTLRNMFKPAVLPGQLTSHREFHWRSSRTDIRRSFSLVLLEPDRRRLRALAALPVPRLVLPPTAVPSLLWRLVGPAACLVSCLASIGANVKCRPPRRA